MSYAETVIDHVPYEINSPGTYVLNSDLSGGGISIYSDNVVLDGRGHKLTNGWITVWDSKDVSIMNIDVINSNNTIYALYMTDCKNCQVSNVVIDNASKQSGLLLEGCENCNISKITSKNNRYGINIKYSRNITVSDIIANNNGHCGVRLDGSDYCTFNSITASGNKYKGIVEEFSDYNTFSNIIAENNGKYGIYLSSSDYNTFNGLKTFGNGIYGVKIVNSKNNTFYNWQIPEGWDNCGNINNSGYNGNIFYNSSSGNSTEGNESSSEVSSGNTNKNTNPITSNNYCPINTNNCIKEDK